MSGNGAVWTIDSEVGRLRDVLLCPADHYAWIPTNDIARRALAGGGGIDQQRLMRQFRELVDALEGAGARCHYLTPRPELPYQVYTRDSSQVTPWGVVLTQLAKPQRRGEVGEVLRFYEASGAPIWNYATAGSLEGGDIHIIRPGLVAIGSSGERTSEAGARQFAHWFSDRGWEVWVTPLAEHFLHLDVVFSMVAPSLALACADVLEDDFLDWLSAQGVRTIPVTYKEAMRDMACNVLALGGDRVLSPRHSVRVNAALRAEGFSVLDPELDLFSQGGGSVHCMTMPLRRDAP